MNPALSTTYSSCVLVVEDDLLIRLIVCDELRDAGHSVVEAGDADEAVILLETLRPGLVITDVKMPGSLDGIGLLKLLKSSMPKVPVIIMSGHCNMEEADENGAALSLRKPFSIMRLVSSVQELLATHKSEQAFTPAY